MAGDQVESETLTYRIELPWCVAGVQTKAGRIVHTAPILKVWLGSSLNDLARYVRKHGGKLSTV